MITVKPNGPTGGYSLWLDGEKVGEVQKKVQRYNLIRPITTIEWVLRLPGHLLPDSQNGNH